MHLVVFVEEESAEHALRVLLPRILGPEHDFEILPFNGKLRLLRELPSRLRAYRHWMPADWGIVVLIDRDRDDCRALKRQLEEISAQAGFATTSSRDAGGRFQVVNRLCVEDLESWFLGDIEAICSAYRGVPATLGKQRRFRDPDAMPQTWEALERVLQQAGHHAAGLAKIKAARDIAAHMQPERNRSHSFQCFCQGVRALVAQGQGPAAGKAPTRRRRPSAGSR